LIKTIDPQMAATI